VRKKESSYNAWLNYKNCSEIISLCEYMGCFKYIVANQNNEIIETAVNELTTAIKGISGITSEIMEAEIGAPNITLITLEDIDKDESINIPDNFTDESFIIKLNKENESIKIIGKDASGVLYGVFYLIRAIFSGKPIEDIETIETPKNKLRMINQWDNISGEIERGYSGKSIFYKDNNIIKDLNRIRDYARLLSSIGINGLVINNVNVHKLETKFITDEYLPDIVAFADVFRRYGIKIFISINFAAPIEIGELETADPLDGKVKQWWKEIVNRIYMYIPDFGGFLVKADSEHRPGPFTYGRNHAEGANLLAEALKPFGGIVIWRCFVYNCQLDWRDRSKDRAKAAYENFKPLDGLFMDNVILQVKNGPMDFQIREPLSPLFGAMERTNEMMEFQIAQEYTGQQKHLCYLVPMWKECLDFDTYAKGEGSYVKKVVDGTMFGKEYGGIAAVSNIGDSMCWTGNPLAQANLYGFGRIAWNPELTSEEIATEWVKLTLGADNEVVDKVVNMLLSSREAYEEYTVPLGIGWMCYPHHHYGPSVDGYEYTPWGTYHYADYNGVGVDRTAVTGTGYIAQYKEPISNMYENIDTCPEELLLFFHHVPYRYKLKSGKTLIQHIYDTHFEGVEKVEGFCEAWKSLKSKIDKEIFDEVMIRFDIQSKDSEEWRDVVNTYFFRRTGIADEKGRKIYK
jgi:alpha-glucuronidase